MDAPLGRAVGNAVEIIECIETLKGQGPADISALVIELATRLLVVSGQLRRAGRRPGRSRCDLVGTALEKMRAMIAWQGGDTRVLDDYSRLPGARARACRESRPGWIRHGDEGGPDRAGVDGARRGAAAD